MSTSNEVVAMRLALEALNSVKHKIDSYQVNVCDDVDEAIKALKETLAKQEHVSEPIAKDDADIYSFWARNKEAERTEKNT